MTGRNDQEETPNGNASGHQTQQGVLWGDSKVRGNKTKSRQVWFYQTEKLLRCPAKTSLQRQFTEWKTAFANYTFDAVKGAEEMVLFLGRLLCKHEDQEKEECVDTCL